MNKIVSYVRKHGVKAAIATFGLTAVQSAMAAVPVAVTTALSDAQTDGVTVATAVFTAVVAMFAFKLMRKGL